MTLAEASSEASFYLRQLGRVAWKWWSRVAEAGQLEITGHNGVRWSVEGTDWSLCDRWVVVMAMMGNRLDRTHLGQAKLETGRTGLLGRYG